MRKSRGPLEQNSFEMEDQDHMLNNLAAMIGVVENKPSRQRRGADKDREIGKYKEELYHQRSNDEFVEIPV